MGAMPPIQASHNRATQFVLRVGHHHFAHLRAVAEGIDIPTSARRYLGVQQGEHIQLAHRQTVEAVRSIARRRNTPAWRLIGLFIRPNACDQDKRPSLEDFIALKELDGWSEAEVAEMYSEAYPQDTRTERRHSLRLQQLELLRTLEQCAAEPCCDTDLVAGWFDDVTADRLAKAGFDTLADLRKQISRGGRWYSTLPAIGPTKARHIVQHLQVLLGPIETPENRTVATFALGSLYPSTHQGHAHDLLPISGPTPASYCGSALPPQAPPSQSLLGVALPHQASPSQSRHGFADDEGAIQAWINARAGSVATAKAYQRDANRLLLWLRYERGGKTFGQLDVSDCTDFMAFLQNIPERWISRARAAPGQPGWAPFKGPLSLTSHRQTIIIVAGLFHWLQSAQYIHANPWPLVNQKTGDDASKRILDTRALSEGAMAQILRFIDESPPSPSRDRIRFLVRFTEAVGLRSNELITAKLGDFSLEPEGWMLQVHGKGAKNRLAVVPQQAIEALQLYLDQRKLGGLQTASAATPLLASIKDPMQPIGYQALYEHVRGWLGKAVNASDLPLRERTALQKASTHWLRHTFGTRAVARDVPLDVIQAQMGHASIQTTMNTYGRAPIKRRIDELGKAFGG